MMKKILLSKKALTIGFWQCLAMMPGTSHSFGSAASIIGGMQQNEMILPERNLLQSFYSFWQFLLIYVSG